MHGQELSASDAEGSALFLSYHSADRKTVLRLSKLLEARGISTFLDRKDLIAGLPWPEELERALAAARAVAVFLGGEGLGAWQKREMWFALDRQAEEGALFPVIPVLLPGANPAARCFLFQNTWIDLRSDPADSAALDLLARAVQEGIEPRAGKDVSAFCPYRGLDPFGEEDAAFFCGREEFSDRLLEAVLKRRFVAVVGPSGSGKSSVVYAGLLPRLRRRRPPAQAWDAVLFTPGERPWHRLATELLPLLEPSMSEVDRLREANQLGEDLAAGRTPLEDTLRRVLEKSLGTGRLLVVADQFEELLTLTSEAARRPFVESLLAITEKQLPVTLALTLRADFYDRALAVSRLLSDRLEGAIVNLGPMRREELARVIRDPAERVGLDFEPGLMDRILSDVGEEPGNLPLLEFALTELWQRRSRGSMTNGAYTEIGGVARAIAQGAETEFARLTPQQGTAARRVFTRLVHVARPEDGGRDTRRRARLADFDEAARDVVDRLAGRETRLLVTGRNESGDGVVEVAHEALIQCWDRLRRWLKEDREFLLWLEILRAHLAEHERNKTLLSGASLADAERWLIERRQGLSAEEVALIEASLKARHAQGRRRRMALFGAGVAALITLLGVVAVWQWHLEVQKANEARVASILAAQGAIEDPVVLGLVAMEIDQIDAPRMKASLDALRFARRAASSPLPLAILSGHEGSVSTAAFSPDSSRVLTASDDSTARIWKADGTSEPIVLRGHQGWVRSAAYSPDGSRVVTASDDGTARIWRADGTGEPVILRGHRNGS